MPYFTLQIDPVSGPLIKVVFAVSKARQDALKAAGKAIPPLFTARGLVDTGASCVCVDPVIVRSLELESRGKTKVATPSTEPGQDKTVDQYDVSIAIYATAEQVPFYLQTIPVIETELLKKFGYHAIIGRDVLVLCHLTYNGQKQTFTFAY